MKLLTIQNPCIDILTNIKPTADYTDPFGAYYDLARYLGWIKFIWALKDIAAFEQNDYLSWKRKGRYCLWVLDIPAKHVTWASLERQCEGKEPSSYIFRSWRDIEDLNETPMGLVESPISKEWVIMKLMVEPCQ